MKWKSLQAILALLVLMATLVWPSPHRSAPTTREPASLGPPAMHLTAGPIFVSPSPRTSTAPSGSTPRPIPTRTSRSSTRKAPSSRPSAGAVRKVSPATGSWWVRQMQDCIARRESGRSLTVVDPSGTYFGRYQFDDPTWHYVTGLSGHASAYGAAQQDAAFIRLFDNGKGRRAWTTYPYCQNLYGGPE